MCRPSTIASLACGRKVGGRYFLSSIDRGILSALLFVTATHRQIAIVSTKFATILRDQVTSNSAPRRAAASVVACSVQHGTGTIAAGATMGAAWSKPKQLTFL